MIRHIPDKRPKSVNEALEGIFGELSPKAFRTITFDNGSEFSKVAELCERNSVNAFFTHPYSSFEKGSVENCNSILTRGIDGYGNRRRSNPQGLLFWITNP